DRAGEESFENQTASAPNDPLARVLRTLDSIDMPAGPVRTHEVGTVEQAPGGSQTDPAGGDPDPTEPAAPAPGRTDPAAPARPGGADAERGDPGRGRATVRRARLPRLEPARHLPRGGDLASGDAAPLRVEGCAAERGDRPDGGSRAGAAGLDRADRHLASLAG